MFTFKPMKSYLKQEGGEKKRRKYVEKINFILSRLRRTEHLEFEMKRENTTVNLMHRFHLSKNRSIFRL